jgi:DNA-binding response OmpR family regulator
MKILLLEDERMLLTSIQEFLEGLGHVVEPYADGAKAFEAMQKSAFDLMILDINVPQIDGFSLLEQAREAKILTPVIYISALADIREITKGFTLGCADYVKKPFHLKELQLRIDNVVRLAGIRNENHLVLSRHYAYDREQKALYFDGDTVELTRRQQQILDLLVRHSPSVVDFERFRESVWEDEPIDNASIRAEVARLRKILKEEFIKNIRGLGYRIEKCGG